MLSINQNQSVKNLSFKKVKVNTKSFDEDLSREKKLIDDLMPELNQKSDANKVDLNFEISGNILNTKNNKAGYFSTCLNITGKKTSSKTAMPKSAEVILKDLNIYDLTPEDIKNAADLVIKYCNKNSNPKY